MGHANEPITYTLQITNSNLITATHITVTATLPTGSTYDSGGTYANDEISWLIPTLAPGEVEKLDFFVTATSNITGGGYSAVLVTPDYTIREGLEQTDDVVLVEPVPMTPTSLDWVVMGEQTNSRFGESVASAGDINGDGFDDVIVGAREYNGTGTSATYNGGRAELYYGTATGLELEPAWSVNGEKYYGWLGQSVAGAGDVNGDGFDDIIIGEPKGYAHIYYGSETGIQSAPDTLTGTIANSWFGYVVASADDLNRDGFDDVMVSTRNTNPDRVYIYYGSATGINTTPAFELVGESTGGFGHAIASAGDVDGNGQPDIIISAAQYGNSPATNLVQNGRVYVYYNFDGFNSTADWYVTGSQLHENLGESVAGAGDVNRDGYDDIVIGAINYDGDQPNEGRVIVYYGSSSGLGVSDRTPDWQVEGQQSGSDFGYSVAGLGDVNGDGVDDIGAGGPIYHQYSRNYAGRAAVFFGSDSGLSSAASSNMAYLQYSSRFGYDVCWCRRCKRR